MSAFDPLPSAPTTLKRRNVCYWHLADILMGSADVRFGRQIGHD